jgi:hypothetical protein
MTDYVFNFIFERLGQYECVPSEKNKKKSDGCFHALNDYGKEPVEAACKRCWREFLEDEN